MILVYYFLMLSRFVLTSTLLMVHLPPPTARNKKDSKKRGGWSIEKRGVRLVATQTRKKSRNGNDAEIEAQADELMDAVGIDA
jgi:hypothetical protein